VLPAEIRAVADCDPALIVHTEEDVARLLERPAFSRFGRAVVIDADGRPVGLVSITDVQRSLRAYKLTDHSDRDPRTRPPVDAFPSGSSSRR